MGEWVAADPIIEADVIRWTEPVFERPRTGKKARPIGERVIVAEVLERTKDGWLRLLVRACTVTRDDAARKTIPLFKTEERIKRAVKTVMHGKPERLLWSDETARAALLRDALLEASRFLSRET